MQYGEFNHFIIQLDRIPKLWEEKTSLYCAYLILKGRKSATIKSYVSAIKHKLTLDGYNWNDNLLLLSALTKACKLVNDVVKTRLPIGEGFLDVIIFELNRYFDRQEYKKLLYRSMFFTAYYGLFRVGELAMSQHSIKACDVHVAHGRTKVKFVLHSSKTHSRANRPKTVVIGQDRSNKVHFFDPVDDISTYAETRPPYRTNNDPFFVHNNGQPVQCQELRNLLRLIITRLDIDSSLYDIHSFRIGRATDLFRRNYSVEYIKKVGRWESNAVYRYLR